jgi:hypothetical protein
MKRLYPALAAALALQTPLPAQASAYQTWLNWAARIAADAGVSIRVQPCSSRRAGSYIPSQRTIVLCQAAVLHSRALTVETLAHEAVHAAQHCVGRATGTGGLVPIGQLLAAQGQGTELLELATQAIRNKALDVTYSTKSNPNTLMSEAEAYALESHPNLAFQLLAAVCRR